jgi:hypothetical protein
MTDFRPLIDFSFEHNCRITGIVSRCISYPTMPKNRLDPTSILLRSYLYQIMYISVAPTLREDNHHRTECIRSYRYSYFLSLVSLPTTTQFFRKGSKAAAVVAAAVALHYHDAGGIISILESHVWALQRSVQVDSIDGGWMSSYPSRKNIHSLRYCKFSSHISDNCFFCLLKALVSSKWVS